MKQELQTEAARIRAENQRREREISSNFYEMYHPANLFIRHGQERAFLQILRAANLLPLSDRSILEVGCGAGRWLAMFESFEAQRHNLGGIDLDEARVASCRQRCPGADIRLGDASELPWPDGQFDIVSQSTVFTSILDAGMKQTVAREMLRVLKPGGAILWYDFHVNNPRNPHVRGIGRAEIRSLFPGCRVALWRTTLAPPLARRLVPISWTLSALLERLRIFNTHYSGILQRSE